ncbi:hypothetical protein POTOM_003871 [Populus tomentosa]|uniref:Wall-associated receptor kinase galacturonan-binding domain-containing protein n=1 Tax=Populus tomentosa TaxID=118781 RepID=A0A8X8AJ76_POPTO|nr:hypothetical protein POTOM_003871 [Populus tomentosa]
MIPRSVSLIFLLLFLVPETATVSALIMAKPNCKDTCGNISIPFPFGIGTGCSMNDWFSVDCNKTTADSPSRAFLSRINIEVLEISIRYGNRMVRVNSPIISSGCAGRGANISIDMTGSPFAFSSSNIFIARGCNNRALLNRIEPEIVGCASTCGANNLTSSSTEGKENSYCSGNNCCQTTIPSSLQVFSASLGNAEDPINDQGRNQCKVAFIVEEEWFWNNISSPEAVQYMQYVPVILDWFLYYGTDIPEGVTLYSDAKNSDPMCNLGYEGNPYLPDGCTDFDQCKIQKVNLCSGMTKCVNVPGWYKCELDKAKITFLSKFLSLNSFFLRNL